MIEQPFPRMFAQCHHPRRLMELPIDCLRKPDQPPKQLWMIERQRIRHSGDLLNVACVNGSNPNSGLTPYPVSQLQREA